MYARCPRRRCAAARRLRVGRLPRRFACVSMSMRSGSAVWVRTRIILADRSSDLHDGVGTNEDTRAADHRFAAEDSWRHRPPQRHTGLVHSDYRFGNMISIAHGRVAAVLDWELCAIGDVLVDVGFLVTAGTSPTIPSPGVWMQEAPTRARAFPAAHKSSNAMQSRPVRSRRISIYYRAFCYWRSAIIGEGIKRRYGSGAMAEGQVDIDGKWSGASASALRPGGSVSAIVGNLRRHRWQRHTIDEKSIA